MATAMLARSSLTNGAYGLRTEKVFVTPEMAAGWLSRNRNNRNIPAPRVEMFVRIIRDGKWCLTHQGIAFYDDNDLADGQTRLTAIVKAGVGVWMFVTYGLQREAIHAIDGVRPRSGRDVLHFLGMTLTTNHVAVVRILWMQYETQRRPDAKTWGQGIADTDMLFKLASATKEAVDFAMPVNKSRGLAHSCYIASVASAWFTQDRDRLLRFKHLISDGTGAESDEQAAIRLRDFLLTSNLILGGREARQELFMRCCTALRAFLERRPISRLYCRPDAVFPIPDLI